MVTHGQCDWSMAPVPDWAGQPVTLRTSRTGDAVTIQARRGTEPWRMVRLARLTPLSPEAATASPFCSPSVRV